MTGSPPRSEAPELRWLERARAGIAALERQAPRLGVLCGTFNPPTCAHVQLAGAAAAQLALDEVLFVVPEIPPHKTDLEAALADREEMLRRVVSEHPRFSAAVSSHGLLLDIHRALAPHYSASARAFFLLGRDAAERILLRWPYRDREEALAGMFARFEFAVAGRAGRFAISTDDPAARYAQRIHPLVLPPELALVSASRVRDRAAEGHSLGDLVTPEVAAYIAERGLYRGKVGAG